MHLWEYGWEWGWLIVVLPWVFVVAAVLAAADLSSKNTRHPG